MLIVCRYQGEEALVVIDVKCILSVVAMVPLQRAINGLNDYYFVIENVELEADYWSYGSPATAHKRAEHPALKPIDRINLRLVHHVLYCAT